MLNLEPLPLESGIKLSDSGMRLKSGIRRHMGPGIHSGDRQNPRR